MGGTGDKSLLIVSVPTISVQLAPMRKGCVNHHQSGVCVRVCVLCGSGWIERVMWYNPCIFGIQ